MGKKIGIMQPYLFPYLGYFQLISAVDAFVLADDLQYINGGWINRNRILVNGKACMITFPLQKGSSELNINERGFSGNFLQEREKLLRRIAGAYMKAPHFHEVFPLIEKIVRFQEMNLALYVENSIRRICGYLSIDTPILISSKLQESIGLKRERKVIAIVKSLGGDVYINPIGGAEIYDFNDFEKEGIDLIFHRIGDIRYRQYENDFAPLLSIIDVMMFNDLRKIREKLSCYSLEGKSSGHSRDAA